MRFHDAQWITRYHIARFIEPTSAPAPPTPTYYPQQVTCQIPTLHALYSRFLGERTGGTFVEVGAFDGVGVSNTWGLTERAWAGVLVEPVPAAAAMCRENHRTHPQVRIVECAIGSVDGADLRLYVGGVLSTANTEVLEHFQSLNWARPLLTGESVVVKTKRLDTLLDEEAIPEGFDVLVVDVEGFESEVFGGFDLGRWRPKLMIIELGDTHPDGSATAFSDAALGLRILEAGYVVAFKDAINTVFVRRDVFNAAFHLDADVESVGDL